MRILILHNALSQESAPDEKDVLVQVEAVSMALEKLGHEPGILPCGLDLQSVKAQITAFSPDLVFNLVESLDGSGRLISVIPSLLDGMGIPYSGSSGESLFITSDKIISKKMMKEKGLPTPAWIGPYPGTGGQQTVQGVSGPGLTKTFIVKSVWEHASLGIDEKGFIRNKTPDAIFTELKERAPLLGGTCFAEEFIDGREFNLSVIAGESGPTVISPAEILFEGYNDKPKIVCYKAKWDETSYEYSHTPRSFEFPPSDRELLSTLENLAIQCWHLFQLKGYARVDFRVDKNGLPYILEVNANPCLSPDAGFAAALSQSGIPFEKAVSWILKDAIGESACDWPSEKKMTNDDVMSSTPGNICFRDIPQPDDPQKIRALIEKTGFFHDFEVAVAVELIEERLQKGRASGYDFIFLEDENRRFLGYSCYGKIPCTSHSYDIYWIAVSPEVQQKGLGKKLIRETENRIKAENGKRIYIDTSDSPKYQKTFSFYKRCGYHLVAHLEEFYGPGDGKVIFLQQINGMSY